MIDIKNISKYFPFFEKNKNISYLDTAASALKLKSVIDKVNYYYNELSCNIFRGAYKLSYDATELYENTRQLTADFINSDFDEIIFTKGATHALNIVANSLDLFLNKDDNLLTSQLEHNSSYLPAYNMASIHNFEISFINLTVDYKITYDNFVKSFKSNTKVVILTHISNVLGYITPIKEITKYAHSKGAIVILDAAQSIPHMKIDVKDLDIDFLVFSGHKLYGPTGVGVLYGKKELLNKIKPYEYGGEMVADVKLKGVIYKKTPYKFEAGTPPIAQVIGLGEAIKFINDIGYENIQNHENMLLKYTYDNLSKIDGITIYNKKVETGIISFNITGIHPHDAASGYDEENICLRAGHHCAGLFTDYANIKTGMLRLSIGIYTTKSDIDRFLDTTKRIIQFFREINI